MVNETNAGQGQGVGLPRQGTGGFGSCKCPKCGKTFPKVKGVPCNTSKCTDCGTSLVGN